MTDTPGLEEELEEGGLTEAQAQDIQRELDEAEGMAVEPVTQWQLFWTRFRRHRLAMIAGFVLAVIVGAALFADLLPLRDPLEEWFDDNGRVLKEISPRFDSGVTGGGAFYMGTDTLGRDVLARVVYGGQTSLKVAGITGLLVATLGTIVGSIAGYYGGAVDQALMRFVDLILSLPLLPVAIVAARILPELPIFAGDAALSLAFLLGFLIWGSLARIVRAEFLSLREKEFVEAARAAGARDGRIIFRHVLPNAISPIIVQTTLIIGIAIILEAALSFLGFGVRPPTPAWGQMAADGGRLIVSTSGRVWWMVFFPGAALIITVLSVNFLGDGLRDALDPKQTIERR